MKKFLNIAVILAVVLPALISCGKTETPKEETIKVTLEITDIADNAATVKAGLESGTFYGAKIVEMVNADDIVFDPSNDIQLVKYVEENGVSVDLPYQKRLEKLRIGIDRFTAVIAYDKNGIAKSTAYKIWSPEGNPEGWSTENNPGSLDENIG